MDPGNDVHAGAVDTDIRVAHGSGDVRWVEMRISGRVDAVGIKGWVGDFREVSDRRRLEDELRHQARTYPLTGLLNRAAFSGGLDAATASMDPAAPPALRAPVVLSGTTLSVTASLGGALGAPGDTAEALLHRADTAMYGAKRAGKDSPSLLGSAAARPV